ncbi:MAG: hypothetical protein HQ526_08790 [Actinobacteria bacterium]|nr:hypothetical protein [Actinomycetota bacterium]
MTSEFDRLFAIVVGALFAAYLLRCFLGGILLGAARIPGRAGNACSRWGEAVTPKLARRVAVGVFGGLAAFTGVSPALAATTVPTPASTPTESQAPGGSHSSIAIPDLDRGPAATPPSDTSAENISQSKAPQKPTLTQKGSLGTIRVKTGDCLWGLAGEQLGSAATDSQIAAQTKLWYSANRSVIGGNPDLIKIGSRLTVPGDPR